MQSEGPSTPEEQHPPRTERMLLCDPKEENKIIGDRLVEEFSRWQAKQPDWLTEDEIYLFCRWLVETGPGAEALGLLNDIPRQLWLDFADRDKPWEVRDV